MDALYTLYFKNKGFYEMQNTMSYTTHHSQNRKKKTESTSKPKYKHVEMQLVTIINIQRQNFTEIIVTCPQLLKVCCISVCTRICFTLTVQKFFDDQSKAVCECSTPAINTNLVFMINNITFQKCIYLFAQSPLWQILT